MVGLAIEMEQSPLDILSHHKPTVGGLVGGTGRRDSNPSLLLPCIPVSSDRVALGPVTAPMGTPAVKSAWLPAVYGTSESPAQ